MIKLLKQFVKDAIASFLFFTAMLTPYMLFVVGIDSKQYGAWLLMQIIIVPPLGGIYSIIARRLKSNG